MIQKDSRTNIAVTVVAAVSTLAVGILGYLGSVRSAEIQANRDKPQTIADAPPIKDDLVAPAREVKKSTLTELEQSEQDARTAIRGFTGVALLEELENELPIGRIAPGRFGFAFDAPLTHPDSLNDQMRLERAGDNDYQFEFHKTSQGELLLVGFVSGATFDALRTSVPDARHQIFSQKTDASQACVALAVSGLTVHDSRKVEPNGVAAALIEFTNPKGTVPVASSRGS